MPDQNRYPRPPLALIVTGEEWLSLSVETLFSPRGYAVLRAFSGAQALERIRQTPPDLLVIAKDLRDMRGVDLCRVAHAQGLATKVLPIMLIAPSAWTREERLEALRACSWDAVSFPMDGEELFLRVDSWVQAKLSSDISREQGLLDAATGLYNAQGLLRRMAEIGAGAGRHSRALACVVVSTEIAPALLADPGTGDTRTWSTDSASAFAECLRVAGRASDAIGRLSENEFVVVAPDTDMDGAMGLAQRLKRVVESAARPAATAPVHLRFGCYAVPNFRDASIAPTEMLIRAAEALRDADSDAQPIRFFERPMDSLN
jgi:PleD family two-component response regulator